MKQIPATILLIFVTNILSPWSFGAEIPKKYRFALSAGYSSVNYSEIVPFQPSRSTENFQQTSVSTRLVARYFLVPPILDLETSTFVTLTPVNVDQSGNAARWLNFNGRLGWIVPWVTVPFSLSVMVGFYYTTMFTESSAFGYQNLKGPQIYPVMSWNLNEYSHQKILLQAYLKYSPVTDGINGLTFTNNDFSMGVSVRFPREALKFPTYAYQDGFSLAFDWSRLNMEFTEVRSVTISMTTWTVSLSYDF